MEINRNYRPAGNTAYAPMRNRNSGQSTTNTENASSGANNNASTNINQRQDTAINTPAATYETTRNSQEARNHRPDIDEVNRMMRESQQQVESFRRMIEGIFNQQGITIQEAIGRMQSGDFVVDEETRAAAQQAISEDGYFGVARTSERILGFAKAISGGDPSRIEMLREAVQQGFDAVANMFGGELPEISQQTLEAVMRGFDEWAESGRAEQ